MQNNDHLGRLLFKNKIDVFNDTSKPNLINSSRSASYTSIDPKILNRQALHKDKSNMLDAPSGPTMINASRS